MKQLRAFIHIHIFDTGTIPNGQDSKVPKNKGNVAEAESGVKNLIWGAHNCRGLPIKLARPETNDDCEVILEDDGDGSAIDEDDKEGIEEGIEINEDADEYNNPPRLIVECPPIPTVKTPHPAMNREARRLRKCHGRSEERRDTYEYYS